MCKEAEVKLETRHLVSSKRFSNGAPFPRKASALLFKTEKSLNLKTQNVNYKVVKIFLKFKGFGKM